MISERKSSKQHFTLEELKEALEELSGSGKEDKALERPFSEQEILEEEIDNYEKEMEGRERASHFIEEKLKDLYFRDLRNIFPMFFGRKKGDMTLFDEVVYEEIFREATERFFSMLQARRDGEDAS